MLPLEKNFRNHFERKIKEAREIAEEASRAALKQLGVGEANPFTHLTEKERDLRRRLRAHGRQLGDQRNSQNQVQEIDRLIEEVAYEHWHRMLFARFLAENQLLMYPDPDEPVAITLEECEDLAAEEGAKNGWELAARYAARMLPQIFRIHSPVFEIQYSPEYQQELEQVLIELPKEIFTASDSLGWVYQFWQAKRKDEVNESAVKIGARELPAVTQLFTEPYMVNFLLDNSIGAWWAITKLLKNEQLNSVDTEETLREKLTLEGVPLNYLRFNKDDKGRWIPAGGTFGDWPKDISEFKLLDPCCGSGHFLVAAFMMLVPMRMELEGVNAQIAIDSVLRENLHGLDIDQRVVEIAAFALAITAWKYPEAGGYRILPELNLACTGLSTSVAKDEWKNLQVEGHNNKIALDWMYDYFKNAPTLGSLLNPLKSEASKIVNWNEFVPRLEEALLLSSNDEQYEMGVVAQGLAKAAILLSAKYNLIVTNVPYLTRGKQGQELINFIDRYYYDARKDLAAVFVERCYELLDKGDFCFVLPQNLFSLTGYTEFRKKMLLNYTLRLFVKLGAGAFETISGENVTVSLITFRKESPNDKDEFLALETSETRNIEDKLSDLLDINKFQSLNQFGQLNNPDARIILGGSNNLTILSEFADGIHGLGTKDAPMFIRNFWELPKREIDWEYVQASIPNADSNKDNIWSGMENVIYWQQGKGTLHERSKTGQAILAGSLAHGKPGILVSPVGDIRVSLYHGALFDKSTAVISPFSEKHLLPILSYLKSDEFRTNIKRLDAKVAITNKTLVKVPFNLDYWEKVSKDMFPVGVPLPHSDDPTQWVFHGHPRYSDNPLQVAVGRLLGYKWPVETDPSIEISNEAMKLKLNGEGLNELADIDGIICIPSVLGESPAVDRLLNLLAAAYENEWSSGKLSQLLSEADHQGKTLETWLRDKFFIQHCKLFQHRPFIWHIWDGLRDGFAVLINYHKLDKKLMERLIYTYLGDWINRQKSDIASDVDGAQEKLAAAEILKKNLELILHGDAPYDIFVRWKPIEEQPIGWDPDINDGVRLNIRPFMSVPDVGKKGAGILRDKPNINWNKDRGKDVESAPWYPVFNGDRINDYHLSLSDKMEARRKRNED